MKPLKKIGFVCEEFTVGSAAQQLLDRFLLGYPRDGEFHKPADCTIAAYCPGTEGDVELQRRAKDHGLVVADSITQAVGEADAVIVARKGDGAEGNEELVEYTLEHTRAGARFFIHGAMAASIAAASALAQQSVAREIVLASGHAASFAPQLPEINLPKDTALKEALIVAQGASPIAELRALAALLPVVEKRKGGEAGVKRISFLSGEAVWAAVKSGSTKQLLAAAISRSDNPLGDPEKDGRTQDLAGLGLIPKLAQNPRGWRIEHADGLRTTLLVLDGVVGDFNLAVATSAGKIHSTQIFQLPKPAHHQFSFLAAKVEDFFLSGERPWNARRDFLTTGLLENFAKPEVRAGGGFATPDLVFPKMSQKD